MIDVHCSLRKGWKKPISRSIILLYLAPFNPANIQSNTFIHPYTFIPFTYLHLYILYLPTPLYPLPTYTFISFTYLHHYILYLPTLLYPLPTYTFIPFTYLHLYILYYLHLHILYYLHLYILYYLHLHILYLPTLLYPLTTYTFIPFTYLHLYTLYLPTSLYPLPPTPLYGNFLVTDFWTPRPLPPPPIIFVHGSHRKCLYLP